MMLAISYTHDSFMGNTYCFEGFTDGLYYPKRIGVFNEGQRIFISYKTKMECVNKLTEICDKMEIGSSRSKLKLLIKDINLTI